MNLTAIRSGIEALLEGLGYTTYDHHAKVLDVPAAVVAFPEDIDYGTSYAGGVELDLFVLVLVARADAEDAERKLNAAVSTEPDPDVSVQPIHPALHDKRSPHWKGGLHVRNAGLFGSYDIGGSSQAEALGCVLRLTVHTP